MSLRELLSTGPNGVILSTDDYFFQDNRYVYDSALIGDAHDWNQKRGEDRLSYIWDTRMFSSYDLDEIYIYINYYTNIVCMCVCDFNMSRL